jgi:hypothetical protein
MSTNKEIYNQPIKIKYSDDIEFVNQLLNIYSTFGRHLTPMFIDLLTYCILEDMNDKNFKDKIVKTSERFKTKRHIDAKMAILKEEGLIEKHDRAPRWRLTPEFQAFKNMVGKKNPILSLIFEK